VAFEFRLPDIGEGVAEGEVVQWFVKEGETVREDAPLVGVLTDKAHVEIPSPRSGKIVKLHAQVGEKVKVGGLLVTIEVEGEAPTPPAAPAAAKKAPTGAAPAPAPATPSPPPPSASAPAAPSAPVRAPAGRVLASPFVRRTAAERGIDLSRITGSGPGGRILESDLEKTWQEGETPVPAPAAPEPAVPAPSPAPPAAAPAGGEPEIAERIPLRGVRRVIAEHMAEATHRAAHFTYVEEVDATELVRFRDHLAQHVEKQGVRLSYLPFIIKGVVAGLQAHPHLNATMDDTRSELVVRSPRNIGIATAAPDGLIVPVLRNAEKKGLLQLAREIQDLSDRGRAGKLTRNELTGSTFTITSLGLLGGVLATPILNYPEVAILGVHKIQRRPVYRADGTIGPADLMNLSVSLDHRVIDGFEGAQFLQVVKSFLEDPHQLFTELA
jgi:pyruvate dehydrogenase E2 component (dihydrolipoyllysine-residue acetyltransferase)